MDYDAGKFYGAPPFGDDAQSAAEGPQDEQDGGVSDGAVGVMLHALGGRGPTAKRGWRNHYVAGPGHHSESHLAELEGAGFMSGRPFSFGAEGDRVYHVTTAGKVWLQANGYDCSRNW